jgi:branched-chain amino acid transport system substrate-binding protein
MSLGGREVAKKRGLKEVLFLEWDFGNRDFGPIAARVKDAKPDLLWIGDIGLEGNMLLEAMKKIDYTPPLHFHLYPAPGPDDQVARRRQGAGRDHLRGASALHQPGRRRGVREDLQRARRAANLPDTHVEVQAAASYSAWQILEAGVRGANSLDDKKIAEFLRKNKIDTIQGRLRFDGPGNYGDDLMKIKQVQGGSWKVIWPTSYAAPGATLQVR